MPKDLKFKYVKGNKKLEKIVTDAQNTIPSTEDILKEAIKKLGILNKDFENIANNFDKYIKEIEGAAFKIYSGYEKKAFDELLKIKRNGLLNEKEFMQCVRELEFKASQMRKSRGGYSLERIFKTLLNLQGIPCERPSKETKKILERIDLVCPDAKTAKNTPDKAIFLAVKRTLRERWKQVVPEQIKGARLYLVTINDSLPENKANEIKKAGMVVYVKDKIKERKGLKDKPWVRKLSNLPKDIKDGIPGSNQKR